jgi:hypothetical protein
MNPAGEAIRNSDTNSLRAILDSSPELAHKPRLILEAGRKARLGLVKRLARKGTDLNASWRGYRPLHALTTHCPIAGRNS